MSTGAKFVKALKTHGLRFKAGVAITCLVILAACGGGDTVDPSTASSLESSDAAYLPTNRETIAQAESIDSPIAHNVAAGRQASQSSTDGLAYEWRAVDGNINGDYSRGSVSSTKKEVRPWWSVNLASAHLVSKVVLWNRTDCCAERLSNFTVFLLNKNGNVVDQKIYPGTVTTKAEIVVSGDDVYSVKVQLNGTSARILTLAEVQVFGLRNVAVFKSASQSSTQHGGVAFRAVDDQRGDRTSFVATHTDIENGAVWQLDLGAPHLVRQITLWNRSDCCSERLSNFSVTYFNDEGHDLTSIDHPGVAGAKTEIKLSAAGVRYVTVKLKGTGILSLDEVQVYGVGSLAMYKPAQQSSTAAGGNATRATDGLKNGKFDDRSVTHTGYETNPWWAVNLGASHDISKVRLWNRTDCCADRLTDFYVMYINESGGEIFRTLHAGSTAEYIDVPIAVTGVSQIKIQLAGAGFLSLAEVEVFPALPTNDGFDTASSIPLRDQQRNKRDFAVQLTGSSIRPGIPYEILFDTGSWDSYIPWGALDKTKVKVLQRNIRNPWGYLTDKVAGQLTLVSRDGHTKYTIDDHVFYALKNDDGTDMPDDRYAPAFPAIMGAFPTAPSFPYAIAQKYQRSGTGMGIGLGMITDTPVTSMANGWGSFKSYLKVGNDPFMGQRINWKTYRAGSDWYPGQPNFDPIVVPGLDVSFQFPSQGGNSPSDLVMRNRIGTFDTGAPDLVLRTQSNNPHRYSPYAPYFTTEGHRPWYDPKVTLQTKLGVKMKVEFKSDVKTCSYTYATATGPDSSVPDKVTVGDWSSTVPWSAGTLTPHTRINVGNSAFYHLPVIFWDLTNQRTGVYCRP